MLVKLKCFRSSSIDLIKVWCTSAGSAVKNLSFSPSLSSTPLSLYEGCRLFRGKRRARSLPSTLEVRKLVCEHAYGFSNSTLRVLELIFIPASLQGTEEQSFCSHNHCWGHQKALQEGGEVVVWGIRELAGESGWGGFQIEKEALRIQTSLLWRF